MAIADFESIINGETVLAHDDALVLRAQKHQAGLEAEWWRAMHPTGRVTGWWNPEAKPGEPTNHGADFDPPEGEPWKPMKERARTLPGGVRLVGFDSTLEVRMGLWGDFRRRYRLALEALMHATDSGVLSYRGKARTPRHKQEAIRNRLKAYWRVAAYEHDLLLTGDVAESLMTELAEDESIPEAQKRNDTIYLKGYGRNTGKGRPMLVKVYRLTKHGMPGVVKLETTFRDDYLRRHGMREPQLWETQPDIQEAMVAALKKQWRSTLKRTPRTRRMLATELGVTQSELYDAIAESENTLTVILRRMEELEARVAKLEQANAEAESQRRHDTLRLAKVEREVSRLRSITATEAEREW